MPNRISGGDPESSPVSSGSTTTGGTGSGGVTTTTGTTGGTGSTAGSASGSGSTAPTSPGVLQYTNAGGQLDEYVVECAAPGQPEQGPAVLIMPGEVVEVRPIYTNTKPVFVAKWTPSAAISGNGAAIIEPGAQPRQLPVRNLADLFIGSTAGAAAGEGVIIAVRRTR